MVTTKQKRAGISSMDCEAEAIIPGEVRKRSDEVNAAKFLYCRSMPLVTKYIVGPVMVYMIRLTDRAVVTLGSVIRNEKPMSQE
jgi:hypothetical protein